jgi:hypothetical protein
MNRGGGEQKIEKSRYPANRTSPWFFLLVVAATVIMILAGVFRLEPVTRVVHWLAVVL